MAQPAHSRGSRSLPWSYCCLYLNALNDTSCCVVGNNSLAFLGFWWIQYYQLINTAHTKCSAHSFRRGGKTLRPFFAIVNSQMCSVGSERHLETHKSLLIPGPILCTVYSRGQTGLSWTTKTPNAPCKLSWYNRIIQANRENIFLHIAQQCKIAEEDR